MESSNNNNSRRRPLLANFYYRFSSSSSSPRVLQHSKHFLFYCADHHKISASFNLFFSPTTRCREREFLCAPMALCYFSYHLIIIAVCTIASFRPELECEDWRGLKCFEGAHHVSFCVFVFRLLFGRQASLSPARERSLIECFLICEVNWHVSIRHHVIKSNLRHPHGFAPPFRPLMAWDANALYSPEFLWVKREAREAKMLH